MIDRTVWCKATFGGTSSRSRSSSIRSTACTVVRFYPKTETTLLHDCRD